MISYIQALLIISPMVASTLPPAARHHRQTSILTSIRPSVVPSTASDSINTEAEVNIDPTSTADSASNSLPSGSATSDDNQAGNVASSSSSNETTENNRTASECDDPCEVPHDIADRLREIQRTMNPNSPLFYILPIHDPLNKTYREEDLFQDNVKRHLWKKSNANCCSTTISDLPVHVDDLEDRSLCPWYYVLDVNLTRYAFLLAYLH